MMQFPIYSRLLKGTYMLLIRKRYLKFFSNKNLKNIEIPNIRNAAKTLGFPKILPAL